MRSNQNSKVFIDMVGNSRYYLVRYQLIVDISPVLWLHFVCSSRVGPHRVTALLLAGGAAGQTPSLARPGRALTSPQSSQSSQSTFLLFIFTKQKGMCSVHSLQSSDLSPQNSLLRCPLSALMSWKFNPDSWILKDQLRWSSLTTEILLGNFPGVELQRLPVFQN